MPSQKLTVNDLFSLEEYARRRPQVRRDAIAEKARRQVAIGDHVRLFFESRVTMHYQIQEMLRVERIFEPEGIREELEAYNPLIPDGDNFKATMMLQYVDVEERRAALARLIGIEDRVWVRVEGFDKAFAIADEDMERANDEKTSSVHFLRFQLDPAMCAAVKEGAALSAGIDHDDYRCLVDPLPGDVSAALRGDLT